MNEITMSLSWTNNHDIEITRMVLEKFVLSIPAGSTIVGMWYVFPGNVYELVESASHATLQNAMSEGSTGLEITYTI